MSYYFYYPPEKKIFVAWRDAQPSENTNEYHPEAEHENVEPQSDVILVRRSARIPQAPKRYGFYVDAMEHELGDHGEPTNYLAALSDPESDKWLEAMNTEMQSMKDNQVWNLVDLPPNCKTVRSKWIFKKRINMDGNIHTYKARLIAKGFTQTYGVDYEETFSPVADIKAIKILIAIAVFYNYKIWQMDVKYAFLNGRLNKDVYMVQPEGPMLQDVKSWLGKCFAIKGLGATAYILRIKIYRDRSRQLIVLSQNTYIDKILKRFKMDVSKHGSLSMQPNVDLSKTQGPFTPTEVKRMKGVPYASTNPRESHWTIVKNILKDLQNTKDMFLVYGGDSTTELSVTCYTDADWETDRDDLRS
ncbi:retrotransposon protein, putative, ty1-copia subclass [Tanacetum coccineum]